MEKRKVLVAYWGQGFRLFLPGVLFVLFLWMGTGPWAFAQKSQFKVIADIVHLAEDLLLNLNKELRTINPQAEKVSGKAMTLNSKGEVELVTKGYEMTLYPTFQLSHAEFLGTAGNSLLQKILPSSRVSGKVVQIDYDILNQTIKVQIDVPTPGLPTVVGNLKASELEWGYGSPQTSIVWFKAPTAHAWFK